jgi:hypothetical protein
MKRACFLLLALAVAGCHSQKQPKPPVTMEPLPAPGPIPHPRQETAVPVDGAGTFEADQVISCEVDVPDLFRVYVTPTTITILGQNPGHAVLHLKIESGDEFDLDVDITQEPPPKRALAVGDQITIAMDGLKALTVESDNVKTTKTSDGTQMIILGVKPGPATAVLHFNDDSTSNNELIVIGGQRLL